MKKCYEVSTNQGTAHLACCHATYLHWLRYLEFFKVWTHDRDSKEMELVVTPTQAITNFYEIYTDNVAPEQNNGRYGKGTAKKYMAMIEVLQANEGTINRTVAWEVLRADEQDLNPDDITSNTQWSVMLDNTQKDSIYGTISLIAQFVCQV